MKDQNPAHSSLPPKRFCQPSQRKRKEKKKKTYDFSRVLFKKTLKSNVERERERRYRRSETEGMRDIKKIMKRSSLTKENWQKKKDRRRETKEVKLNTIDRREI